MDLRRRIIFAPRDCTLFGGDIEDATVASCSSMLRPMGDVKVSETRDILRTLIRWSTSRYRRHRLGKKLRHEELKRQEIWKCFHSSRTDFRELSCYSRRCCLTSFNGAANTGAAKAYVKAINVERLDEAVKTDTPSSRLRLEKAGSACICT